MYVTLKSEKMEVCVFRHSTKVRFTIWNVSMTNTIMKLWLEKSVWLEKNGRTDWLWASIIPISIKRYKLVFIKMSCSVKNSAKDIHWPLRWNTTKRTYSWRIWIYCWLPIITITSLIMSIPLRGLTTGVVSFTKGAAGENSLIRIVNLKTRTGMERWGWIIISERRIRLLLAMW